MSQVDEIMEQAQKEFKSKDVENAIESYERAVSIYEENQVNNPQYRLALERLRDLYQLLASDLEDAGYARKAAHYSAKIAEAN